MLNLPSSSSFFTFFETWDTLNYTNNGVMTTDTGFKFDTQVTNAFGDTVHLTAANFYNPGVISCASVSSIYFSSYLLALPGEFDGQRDEHLDARRLGGGGLGRKHG